MKKLLLSVAIIALVGCETTPENTANDEVIVTGSRSKTTSTSSKPAPPPPVPSANYTCWDGTSVFNGSQCPAQPSPVVMQAPAQTLGYSGAPVPSAPPLPGSQTQQLAGGYTMEIAEAGFVPAEPAYETVTETIVVQEASSELITVPPTYYADGTIATPARTMERSVPAVTKTETRRVLKSTPLRTRAAAAYILRKPDGSVVREFASAEEYAKYQRAQFKDVAADPVSTFSVDVDTASYTTIREYVERGQTPPEGSVRIEEMINYFDYNYDLPSNLDQPFRPNVSIVPTPWNAETQLMHIGIKGYEEVNAEQPPLNLVFLIDVSGSMRANNKLPLVKKSLGLLVNQMRPQDRISIVTYASGEEVILKAARGSEKEKILEKIEALSAGGSTSGEAGMQKAYELAERYYKRRGVNRVIMATDGDFNVGISDPEELKKYVSEKRESGVYLSIFGYGRGNLKDNRIQALAQNGNGMAGYIDSMREARKVFDDDFSGNLFPIANDVKIQVEFNPAKVGSYRLIGYETRALARQDFNNDKVDAGDIGAGHSVTAIYEISSTSSGQGSIDPLRYSAQGGESAADFAGEYAFVKLRYKKPGEDVSNLITHPVTQGDVFNHFDAAPESARFATSVAAYGMKLRGDEAVKDLAWSKVTDMARSAKGVDPYGYRAEFVSLTRDASVIKVPDN